MAKRQPYSVYDVFTPTTQARVNYVDRPAINDQFVDAIRTPGKQLIVYGESGSGKSTLLANKLDNLNPDYITTRCSAASTFEAIVLDGFDKLKPFYTDTSSRKTNVQIKAGIDADFKILKTTIEATVGSEAATGDRRALPPQLTVQRLGEFMGAAWVGWLIEDFHKVPEREKTKLAQAFKVFSDLARDFPKAKIIAVGATDTARQVVQYDPEMSNRVSELYVPLMDDHELRGILDGGGKLLNVDLSLVASDIVQYSVGVPSACHQLALNVCLAHEIEETLKDRFQIPLESMKPAIDRYVREFGDTLRADFELALASNRMRKYDNPAVVLKALASGPLSGMRHFEVLDEIRKEHPKYSPGNLTNYLKALASAERGNLIRSRIDKFHRFVTPLHHTYAQAALGVKRKGDEPRVGGYIFTAFLQSEPEFWHTYTQRPGRRKATFNIFPEGDVAVQGTLFSPTNIAQQMLELGGHATMSTNFPAEWMGDSSSPSPVEPVGDAPPSPE